jgi:AcrR family transcriptional regulator
MKQAEQKYHHGDLRNALLHVAAELVRDGGVEALSLRKLAEKAGVSRAAPYHHFADKRDLLAALAEQGFATLTDSLQAVSADPALSLLQQLEETILGYVRFAVQNQCQYDLMFGSELWRRNPSPRLQRCARDSFRQYAGLIATFHRQGLLSPDEDPLRLAQVMWATLHGLVKLTHDGIFVRQDDLHEISRYAVVKLLGMLGGCNEIVTGSC